MKSKNLNNFDSQVFTKNIEVNGVKINSAQVKNGDLFIALPGLKTHGSNFLQDAINNGAVAVLSDISLESSIPSFIHPAPREIVGSISAWLFDFPFNHLKAVGITGTNGKSTTADLIKQLWDANKLDSGLIGTLGVKSKNSITAGVRTTPEANELHQIAASMVNQGVSHLVMEVSSHALEQSRIKGAKFEVVGFSNLTQDHLDYHKSMENYFAAKAKLFTNDYADKAVINIDDLYGIKLAKAISIPYQSISRLDKSSDWFFSKILIKDHGYEIEIGSKLGNKIIGEIGLKGDFNLDNLLLAVAITASTGLSDSEISQSLKNLKSVSGRLEQILLGQNFSAFIDYAHTPDAVARVLKAARAFTTGRVIAVLGCGGERDKTKRPLMGSALYEESDLPIFTSDNPRSESASNILKEMTADLRIDDKGKVIENRKEAIDYACQMAAKNDCIIILGKGHEVGQEINGVIHPFDDRIELTAAINRVLKQ